MPLRDVDGDAEFLDVLVLSTGQVSKLALGRQSGWAVISELADGSLHAIEFEVPEPGQWLLTLLLKPVGEVERLFNDFCGRVDLERSAFPSQQLIDAAIRSGLARARFQWTGPAVDWIEQLDAVARYRVEMNVVADSAVDLDFDLRSRIARLLGRDPTSIPPSKPETPNWWDV